MKPEAISSPQVLFFRKNNEVLNYQQGVVIMTGMTRTRYFILTVLALAAIVFLPNASGAQASSPAALTGIVSSQEEGPMEGVVVSAKREGSTITISLMSNAQGQFRFPRTKLEPGRYALHMRAVG